MANLSVRRVDSAKPGRHVDGAGLMLVVKPTGRKSWIVRVQHEGRRRDIGLGGYPMVRLASARELALDLRRQIRNGVDTVASRRRQRSVPTLAEALDLWIAKEAPDWRGGIDGHTAKTTPRLFERHLPGLMRTKVSVIDETMIVAALMTVWHERRETAKKLYDRLRGTMLLAKANSAASRIDWDEVRAALPSGKVKAVHHAAMPVQEVPKFAAWLKEKDTTAARALLLIILTAVRSGELRGAQWNEMELSEALGPFPARGQRPTRSMRFP